MAVPIPEERDLVDQVDKMIVVCFELMRNNRSLVNENRQTIEESIRLLEESLKSYSEMMEQIERIYTGTDPTIQSDKEIIREEFNSTTTLLDRYSAKLKVHDLTNIEDKVQRVQKIYSTLKALMEEELSTPFLKQLAVQSDYKRAKTILDRLMNDYAEMIAVATSYGEDNAPALAPLKQEIATLFDRAQAILQDCNQVLEADIREEAQKKAFDIYVSLLSNMRKNTNKALDLKTDGKLEDALALFEVSVALYNKEMEAAKVLFDGPNEEINKIKTLLIHPFMLARGQAKNIKQRLEAAKQPDDKMGSEAGTDANAGPSTEQDAAPGSEQDAPLGSEQDVAPGSEQDVAPGSEQEAAPGSEQDVEPGADSPQLRKFEEAKQKFELALEALQVRIADLGKKSGERYKTAKTTAEALRESLKGYAKDLSPQNLEAFRGNCIKAIDGTRDVLEKHRGWGGVLNMLITAVNAVVRVFSCGVKNSFFKPRITDSAKVLNKLKDSLGDSEAGVDPMQTGPKR